MIKFIILSYIQILILPGLIYCFHKKKFDIFLIFSLSIFLNYLLVTIINLTLFEKNILFKIIIFIELIILIYLSFKQTVKKNYYNLRLNINVLDIFLILIFLALLIKFSQYYKPFFGSLFQEGDVLLSWNEWAYNIIGSTYTPEYLIQNNFESKFYAEQSRSYYGQLVPSMWSIFYLLTNMTDITNFPKFLNFIFSVFSILLLIQYFLKTKNIFYFFLFVLLIFFFFKEHAYFVYSGLVDAPMAIFIFLSLIHIIKLESVNKNKINVGIVFAIVASNIKLSALYYSVVFLPFYLYFYYFDEHKYKIFYYIFLLVFFSLWWPFYQYFFFDINVFVNNNLNYLDSISVNNISDGIDRISTLFGSHFKLILVSIFFLISIFVKKINVISVFLILPYIIIWYNFTSYDIRNLLLIVPLICLLISYLLSKINVRFPKIAQKNIVTFDNKINKKITKNITILILIFISFLILMFEQPIEKSFKKDISNKKINIKNPLINQYILDNLDEIDNIITDYVYLKFVLNLEQSKKVKLCNMFQKNNFYHCNFNEMENNLVVTYYGDNLFNIAREVYVLKLIRNFDKIKVYSIIKKYEKNT